MGDHLVTLIAYAAMALIAAWWFWRTQAGVVNPTLHAVVSIIFGVLWPLSLPWHVFVRAASRVIARYRPRRIEQCVDERIVPRQG